MHDLTGEDILAVHAGAIRDGGDARVLSEGNLHQAVFQLNLLQDPRDRAAAALYLLCAYPVFREGNERTALEIAKLVLIREGWTLIGDESDLFSLTRGVCDFSAEIEDIRKYLQSYAVKPDPE